MPGIYAHYRMGSQLLSTLPGDTRRTVQRCRRLFDAGLHGADIFLFFSPLLPTAIGSLGSKFHAQTGKTFFQRVCRMVRMERSEGAQAYLYGVLCHYALASRLHPFIKTQAQTLGIHPDQIATEFDRFLLELDGKVPPESQDLSGHLKLTPGECATVAKFYPSATSRQVQDSLRNMAAQRKLFATPEGSRRTALRKSMQAVRLPIRHLLMTTGADPACCQLDEQLLELYEEALLQVPDMLRQVQENLIFNVGFGEEFSEVFG